MQNTIKPRLVALLSLVSVVGWSPRSHVDCIVFDEVQSLNVWLTVSSLANKDPNNKSNILFRQIELNWINAPLNDDGDYLALYLDTEPDAPGGATPVSVHHPSGISGKLLVPDHYFPVIDFYNETFQQHEPTTTAAADNQLWPTDNNNSNHLNPSSIEREASPPTPQAPSSSRFGAAQYESERRTVLVPNGDRWNTYYLRFSRPDVGLAEIAREVPPGSVFEIGRTARRQDQGPEPSSLNVRADSTQKSRLVEECVGYCVAYHSQRKILAKSCLRTRPNWMQESQIGSRSLTTIAIAGTHNSGTYLKQRPNTHKIDKSVLQLINKYQLNQEENVFNQLMYGIRYLDLRIGFTKVKHRPEELWVYHDIFRTDNSLNEILKQIKRFLELARGEIVIIDFHRFTVGFQNEDPETELERHGKVLELLFKTLGEYIVPSYLGQNGPLNEYIGLNKRLFVGYAGRSRLLSLQSAAASDDHSIQLGASGQQLVAQQQQVRDIDADKQDEENGSNNQTVTRAMSAAATTTGAQPKRAHSGSSPYNLDDDDDENRQQEMLDRRLGTRVYNRLKSLKLISHSFSKRSIELHSNNNNTNKSNHSEYNSRIVKHSRAKIVGNIYKVRERIIQPQPLATERSMRVVHTTSESLLSSSSLPVSFNSRLSLLFNPVHHVWPNTDKEETLRQFIEQSACRKYFGELNSLMAELTPTVFGAISDKYDGIRRLSSLTNRMVGDLIRSKFLHCINLIATDYFLGNDLIRLTIYANKLRQQQQHTRNTDLEPLQGKCKSFRHIRPILEKYKHTTAAMDNTNSILSSSAAAGATPSSSSSSGPYQSESGGVGISDIITSLFKRLFN